MANVVQDPTVSLDVQALEGVKELYLCPSDETLNSDDLVPSTANMGYPSFNRDVTDVRLDGGGSRVVPSPGGTYDPITVDIYLAENNAKLREIEDAIGKEEGSTQTLMKYNIFAPDESGWKGACYVTGLTATDDSGYHYQATLRLQTADRISVPA